MKKVKGARRRCKLSLPWKKRIGRAAAVLLCAALTVGVLKNDGWLQAFWQPVMLSAGIVLPEGGEEYVRRNGTIKKLFASAQPVSSIPEEETSSQSVSSTVPEESDTSSENSSPESALPESSVPAESGTESLPEDYKPVKEVQLDSAGNLSSGIVSMRSRSAAEIDIAQMLSLGTDVTIQNTDEPQVLIVHTHTSEAYMEEFTGSYPTSFSARTDDPSHSVIRVGDAIAETLNNAGIVTIHDTTYHDDPAYKGAYFRSLATMEEYLEKYPSIQVILDVHRDCLEQADGTKLKPTATVNGKKAAQIMIVSGCDDNATLGYPEWKDNLRFGLQLQKSLSEKYPGLARPLYCWNIRYNQHLRHGALLVEFGTEANTYDEVQYSGELFADCLAEVLESLKE